MPAMHRTFANAVLMGVNQFGVGLGKEIAKKIDGGGAGFDASTEALLTAAGLSS
jgi:glucose-6-phosphate isomerase